MNFPTAYNSPLNQNNDDLTIHLVPLKAPNISAGAINGANSNSHSATQNTHNPNDVADQGASQQAASSSVNKNVVAAAHNLLPQSANLGATTTAEKSTLEQENENTPIYDNLNKEEKAKLSLILENYAIHFVNSKGTDLRTFIKSCDFPAHYMEHNTKQFLYLSETLVRKLCDVHNKKVTDFINEAKEYDSNNIYKVVNKEQKIDLSMKIIDYIKSFCDNKKISYGEFSRKLKHDRSYISVVSTKKSALKQDEFKKIAAFFHVSVDQLLNKAKAHAAKNGIVGAATTDEAAAVPYRKRKDVAKAAEATEITTNKRSKTSISTADPNDQPNPLPIATAEEQTEFDNMFILKPEDKFAYLLENNNGDEYNFLKSLQGFQNNNPDFQPELVQSMIDRATDNIRHQEIAAQNAANTTTTNDLSDLL